MEPRREPRSSTRQSEVGRQEDQGDRVGPPASTGPTAAGAASSPIAATRNSPVDRLLNSRSSATSPCQSGRLELPVGVVADPAERSRSVVVRHRGQRPRRRIGDQQRGDARPAPPAAARRVVARHVQPGVDRVVRQPVGRGPVDAAGRRSSGSNSRLDRPVAVEVGVGDAPGVQLARPGGGPARGARRAGRTGSRRSGRPWRRPGSGRRAGGRSRACTCGRGRRQSLRVMTPNGQAATQ